MASKSRSAQEALTELEKGSASFDEQLVEAAKFIGSDLDTIRRSAAERTEVEGQSQAVTYHGREEWLLRWLLKNLQAPKDNTPRSNSSSWRLLCHLLRIIPLPIVARILVERKFLSILQRTLEDAKDIASHTGETDAEESSDSGSADRKDTSEKSKKRKRFGELVKRSRNKRYGLRELLASINSVVDFMVKSTKPTTAKYEEGRSVAFSAEYMKAVIRTTAEDAAKLLGSWLSLLKTPYLLRFTDKIPWLSPFVEVWENHIADDNHLMNFSLYCTLPLLSLQSSRPGSIEFEGQINQLIARNVMIPAKAAKMGNTESTLLNDLTRISVIYEPLNAAHLFEIAIRSLQPQGVKRRRENDGRWLQIVFATLKEAMSPKKSERNGRSICAMIQSAIFHKVGLELPVLRSITAEYALPTEGDVYWELLSMIIKLDANVFFIPDGGKDLLQELLTRVTRASFEPSWPEISEFVIETILVRLMGEFAKARDLSGFIRHWYAQLIEFEKLREESRLSSIETFGAWEDEILQKELTTLLEASLTTQQITQLLDWLDIQVLEHRDAACVILEAIAGSISREEVVDMVNLRCYHIMFGNDASEKLDGRYTWRSWRIISRTLKWLTPTGVEALADLWKARAKPFDSLTNEFGASSLLGTRNGNTVGLDSLEILRCVCAAWSTAKKGSHMQRLAKPVLLSLLQRLSSDTKRFQQDMLGDSDLGKKEYISRPVKLQRGVGWMILSFLRCTFIEYPQALLLASELKDDNFEEMLHTVFWVASAAKLPWLRANGTSFDDLWTQTLHCDEIFNNSDIVETMIDIMLENETHCTNPLIESTGNNGFAIQSLLQLSAGTFHRKYRERILKGWLPASGGRSKSKNRVTYEATALDPAVLSLKVKIMQQPMFYEGMNFQELVNLGDVLADSAVENPHVNLALLKEFSRLSIEFVFTNLEQPRNQEYITDAFNLIRKKVRKSQQKSKYKSNYATINLFQVVLAILNAKAKILQDLSIISTNDLTGATSLFKESLFLQLQGIIENSAKGKSSKGKLSEVGSDLAVLGIIDALTALGVDGLKLSELECVMKSFATARTDSELSVGKRLNVFMASRADNNSDEFYNKLDDDISTTVGRQAVAEKTRAAISTSDSKGKLSLLKSILLNSTGNLIQLDKLLAARHIILSLEDTRRSKDEEDENSDEEEVEPFDLSAAYCILCNNLWKTTGTRQFCLISETLELILRTKARSISQWNIDSTLGSISMICSRNAPLLRPSRAGSIFLHLCHLLQAILTSHRLKLEGHFHILVQTLQALLRCLFTPLPHSSAEKLKYYAPPSWLTSISARQLSAKHTAAYTRLITLICDPSVSSVTRSQHNNLTSATDKAKRMAGQHMQFVLATYVKLQLEMKMLPEVREKMVPGLYAIFDTTTPELRRCISDSLDSSGRAVFGMLYKDYVRFGKWKGS